MAIARHCPVLGVARLGCFVFVISVCGCASQLSGDYDFEPIEPQSTVSLELPHGVLLLNGRSLPRPAQVVGIVDVQMSHDGYQTALDQLAGEAAELGADAIVGVEFHHGRVGETSHLSGLAVRVLR